MSLWDMSLAGGVIILAATVLRAVTFDRLPKGTFLCLWAVALCRLLTPYTLPSTLSVYTLWERLTATEPAQAAVTPGQLLPTVQAPHGFAPVTPDALTVHAPVNWLAVIWLAVALTCSLFFALSYCRCRREFRLSMPVDNAEAKAWLAAHPLRRRVRLRVSDRITTPLTYGVARPVILLPKDTDWTDGEGLSYVLCHELYHIRRFDAVTKLLLTAAVCLHWFNPAVWVMYALANRDLELSCDEAVVRQLGPDRRRAYAAALIRMEERRGGPAPLINHFSKNAMEERIVAIMKIRKTPLTALILAVTLVAGVTIALATTAEPGRSEPPAGSQLDNPDKTTTEVWHVTSYVDPYDGKTYYSADSGQTWQEGDPFAAAGYAYDDVDWWTAEEYETWLAEQKKELQSMLGERSWNPTEGWYTWDQDRIDAAIAGNEQLLREIKEGKLVSKPTQDGDTMIQFSYDPRAVQTVTDDSALAADAAAYTDEGDTEQTKLLLDAYAPFGLRYDMDVSTARKLSMSWQGKPVHSVFDAKKGVWIANNMRGLDLGPDAIDLRAVYNSNGVLTGLEEVQGSAESGGERSQEDLLAEYGHYGISFDSAGNMLYEGVVVGLFVDGVELDDGGWAMRYVYQSDVGAQCLRTLRDRKDNGDGSYDPFGPLTGIRAMTDRELSELRGLRADANLEAVAVTYTQDKDSGVEEDDSVDFRDAFNEKFKPYGVSFVPSGDFGNVYWNGRLVKTFEDKTPDGGYQTISSVDGGELSLKAVYGADGKLTGVAETGGSIG